MTGLPSPQRHALIDALRGFALAGVALVNLRSLSLYALMPEEARAQLATAGFDAMAAQWMAVLVDTKFITLFSFLFGLGFALQVDRVDGSSDHVRRTYVRRMLGLALIGMVHGYFVWWGDILLTYAVVGLILLPLRRLSDHGLIAVALLVAVLPPVVSTWVRGALPALPTGSEALAYGLAAFASPDWRTALQGNAEMANWARMANWALVCFVLSRFLLGYWAGRKGLLQVPAAHRPLLKRLAIGGALLGLVLMGLGEIHGPVRAANPALDTGAVRLALRMVLRLESIALATAYAAGFALLFTTSSGRSRLAVLAPVGRMALTHYLLQSVAGIGLFYGAGLGLGPRWGLPAVLATWVVMFAAQVVLSYWWLAHYHYGPVEWVWRWITRGTRPVFRREPPSRQVQPAF